MRTAVITVAVLSSIGAGATQAQSSVTVWGVVDAALQKVQGAGNGSITRMVSGANQSSQLGFRGVEDLGGGLSASFWLEAGMNNDSGSFQTSNTNNQASGGTAAGANGTQGLTFNRRSTVSIAGAWGELRLGRDYVPSFWQSSRYDVFGHVGSATSFNLLGALGNANGVVTNLRASNSIGYFLPAKLGGVYGQAMYALGENPSNVSTGRDNGKHVGARIGYAAGPVNVSYGSGRTRYGSGDYVQGGLAGSFDFGVLQLFGGLYREEIRAAAVSRAVSRYVAISAPVNQGQVKVSFVSTNQNAAAGNNDGTQLGLGYVHHLSKRTALYATYSLIDNKGASMLYHQGRPTATPGGRSTGLDLGLRHTF